MYTRPTAIVAMSISPIAIARSMISHHSLGLKEGIERGRSEERQLLCRQAARKFDAETASRLAALLDRLSDPERLAEVGDWIIECETEAELLGRVQDALP